MKTALILGVSLLAVGILVVFFTTTKSGSKLGVDVVNSEPSIAPTFEPTPSAQPTPSSELLAGGSSYRDTDGVFTFLYPNDYELDEQDKQHPRIYKRGEEQRPQSEMTNGIILVFESVELKGQTLAQLVDARIAEATADDNSELTGPKQETVINNYSGFKYEMDGFGSSQNFIIQKNAQSPWAVVITAMIADPKQQNYEADMMSVLSTLELQK